MKKNEKNAALLPLKRNSGIILCAFPILCCIILKSFGMTDEANIKILMRLALCGILAYACFSQYKGKLDKEKVILLIVLSGCVLRVGYTFYTHAFVRSHDIGMNSAEGVGHWGYFYHIINGNLPPSNEHEFYQPPFYYIVSGIFIKLMMLIGNTEQWGGLEYIPQTVSCVCSVAAMVTFVKIMDELKLNKNIQIAAAALTAFYPVQVLAAGRMNNDAMVEMFMLLSLYGTIRWHKSRKMSDIVFIAFSIGLGMMTKISCAVIAFVTGPVMIYHFVKTVREKDAAKIKEIITQFAVFAVICCPLGLWYGIRNYIEFGQPLNFVHEPSKGLAIYTGDESWVDKWLKLPLNFKAKPYSNMAEDCSVWMLLLKSGVHGEFTWDNISNLLAWTIDYVHLFLMLIMLFSVAFVMVKDKELDKTAKYGAFWVWALIGVSYIQFNIQYPFSCTADSRYVFPAAMAASIFVGCMCDYMFKRRENKMCKSGFVFFTTVIVLFCAMSTMHFC